MDNLKHVYKIIKMSKKHLFLLMSWIVFLVVVFMATLVEVVYRVEANTMLYLITSISSIVPLFSFLMIRYIWKNGKIVILKNKTKQTFNGILVWIVMVQLLALLVSFSPSIYYLVKRESKQLMYFLYIFTTLFFLMMASSYLYLFTKDVKLVYIALAIVSQILLSINAMMEVQTEWVIYIYKHLSVLGIISQSDTNWLVYSIFVAIPIIFYTFTFCFQNKIDFANFV